MNTSPLIVPRQTATHDELRHIVCCCDGDSRTFCGLDGRTLSWRPDETPCVVCDEMEATTDLCPRGGLCPHSKEAS